MSDGNSSSKSDKNEDETAGRAGVEMRGAGVTSRDDGPGGNTTTAAGASSVSLDVKDDGNASSDNEKGKHTEASALHQRQAGDICVNRQPEYSETYMNANNDEEEDDDRSIHYDKIDHASLPPCARALVVYLTRWVVLPETTWRLAWDLFVTLATLVFLVLVPFELGFDSGSEVTAYMSLVLVVVFSVDMFLNFITAYEDEKTGRLVRDPIRIASHYVRGWFIPDLVSTIPWISISTRVAGLENLKLIRILRLIGKLSQLPVALQRNEKFGDIFTRLVHSVSPSLLRFVKLLFSVLFLTHYCACYWYFVGRTTNDPESWIERVFSDDPVVTDSLGTRYLVSYYFTLTTLTTVGYGDISPRTNREIAFVMFLQILGAIVFAYFAGTLASMISALEREETSYRENMRLLHTYLSERASFFPGKLRREITRYMSLEWLRESPSGQQFASLLEEIPFFYRRQMAKSMLDDVIDESNFLSRFKPYDAFITAFAERLSLKNLRRGAVMFHRNTPIDTFCVIRSGSCQIHKPDPHNLLPMGDHGPVIWTLNVGDVLGLIGLLGGQSWPSDVMVDEAVTFWFVPMTDFKALLERYDLLGEAMTMARSSLAKLSRKILTAVPKKSRASAATLTKKDKKDKKDKRNKRAGTMDSALVSSSSSSSSSAGVDATAASSRAVAAASDAHPREELHHQQRDIGAEYRQQRMRQLVADLRGILAELDQHSAEPSRSSISGHTGV